MLDWDDPALPDKSIIAQEHLRDIKEEVHR